VSKKKVENKTNVVTLTVEPKSKKPAVKKAKKMTAKQQTLHAYQTGNMSIIALHQFGPTGWEMFKGDK
jgi:hypothetical protein